jgi:hypothetical protein
MRLSFLSDLSDIWTPYPSLVGGVAAHTSSMVKALVELNIVVFESSSPLFQGSNHLENLSFSEVRDAADELYARLQAWKANIDECLREEVNKTPHALSLQ